MQETPVQSLGQETPWRRERPPTAGFSGSPCGSAGKESTCNVGELGSIPGSGRSSKEGNGYPLQYSGLENSMGYIVHGVTKSWTRLSDFYFHNFIKLRNQPKDNILGPCIQESYHCSLVEKSYSNFLEGYLRGMIVTAATKDTANHTSNRA